MLFKNISFLLLLLSLLLCFKGVIGGEVVRIKNVNDLKNFVNNVNTGSNYLGATVYLDSDLSLSGETLEPIGKDYYNSNRYFRGVFDGQGYIISDLKMNSNSEYTGLFGYSKGLTIKNVVLDSSCSIKSSYSYTSYVGGIIGHCNSENGQCNVENSVNMASVTFSRDISGNSLILGGIAGYLYNDFTIGYSVCMKNCANYGSVTYSGTSYNSYIGGIAGRLQVPEIESGSITIYNCINYGAITHAGYSIYLYLGGIAGFSLGPRIDNCVNAGKISAQNTPKYDSYIGGIVGRVSFDTDIKYCYWTSELNEYNLYGYVVDTQNISYALRYNNTTFELNESISVGNYTGNSLIDALNAAADYYVLRGYSKWLLNREKKSINFIINSRTSPITMDHQIILLPSLASEGSLMFDGWYNDSECTEPLESFENTDDIELYSTFKENTNNYTITFDTRREGVTVAPITAQFGTVVALHSYCISSWETEYDDIGFNLTMPAHNFTLYTTAWKCTRIASVDDFIDFSKVVNSGADDYHGTTVYLDTDLSLSDETFEPIGKDDSNCFRGTFDGQGHIISDFKMDTYSSQYTGLFGYSEGLTIRNVVLDSSCSITSSYSGSSNVYVGGIIGECWATSGECNIESSVNMADVTFNGNAFDYGLSFGSIAGYFSSYSYYSYSPSYPCYVKNCANYGSVTHSGTSESSDIGGIIGEVYGYNSVYNYVYNCLNYGAITHSGTTSYGLRLGGIVGSSNSACIENCVSAGKIFTQNTPSDNSYIGGIVGSDYNSRYKYCYHTSDTDISKLYKQISYTSRTTKPSTSATTVDSLLITNLNNYASENKWNKWLFNEKSASVTFVMNHGKGFTVKSQVILSPDPVVDDGNNFTGWYKDRSFKKEFSSSSISSDITLYGQLIAEEQKYSPMSEDPFSIPGSSKTSEDLSNISGSSDKSANYAEVLNPFMQLVYFLL